jgi:hypothetical protein
MRTEIVVGRKSFGDFKKVFKMPKTGITANLIASQDSSEESFSCVFKQGIS